MKNKVHFFHYSSIAVMVMLGNLGITILTIAILIMSAILGNLTILKMGYLLAMLLVYTSGFKTSVRYISHFYMTKSKIVYSLVMIEYNIPLKYISNIALNDNCITLILNNDMQDDIYFDKEYNKNSKLQELNQIKIKKEPLMPFFNKKYHDMLIILQNYTPNSDSFINETNKTLPFCFGLLTFFSTIFVFLGLTLL